MSNRQFRLIDSLSSGDESIEDLLDHASEHSSSAMPSEFGESTERPGVALSRFLAALERPSAAEVTYRDAFLRIAMGISAGHRRRFPDQTWGRLVIRDSSDAFAPPRESDNPDNGSIPSDTAEMLIREIEAKLREAANRSAAARSVSSGRGIPSPTPASAAFRERIDEIVALEPNWDLAGAEPISAATGKMVLQVAEAVLDLAAEPFVGPAPDGTVLLQWTMADGRVIDAYVGEEWPEFVMVDDSGEVVEVEIPEPEALRRQLKSR